MLAMNKYTQAYVDDCRAAMKARISAFKALKPKPATAFELSFFSALAVVLDRMFVHRTRGREGKDGNPLNEVRMLCDFILENGCVLAANKTIKYAPAKAVTGIAIGQKIALSQSDFVRLQEAFFAGIEAKFT